MASRATERAHALGFSSHRQYLNSVSQRQGFANFSEKSRSAKVTERPGKDGKTITAIEPKMTGPKGKPLTPQQIQKNIQTAQKAAGKKGGRTYVKVTMKNGQTRTLKSVKSSELSTLHPDPMGEGEAAFSHEALVPDGVILVVAS